MQIEINVSEKDNIEAKLTECKKTFINIGDVKIFIEDKKTAEYLLEELERVLRPEEQHKSTLENKIEELIEKIDELEQELETPESDKEFYHKHDV